MVRDYNWLGMEHFEIGYWTQYLVLKWNVNIVLLMEILYRIRLPTSNHFYETKSNFMYMYCISHVYEMSIITILRKNHFYLYFLQFTNCPCQKSKPNIICHLYKRNLYFFYFKLYDSDSFVSVHVCITFCHPTFANRVLCDDSKKIK